VELPVSITPSGANGVSTPGKVEPGESFRRLLPSEQQLACVCALFGGARAGALIENLQASGADRLRDAVKSLAGLDRAHRLKIFVRALAASKLPTRAPERIPPRLEAVMALAAPGAHSALRTYAVRSRTSR
jgi:hypothetical protein